MHGQDGALPGPQIEAMIREGRHREEENGSHTGDGALESGTSFCHEVRADLAKPDDCPTIAPEEPRDSVLRTQSSSEHELDLKRHKVFTDMFLKVPRAVQPPGSQASRF